MKNPIIPGLGVCDPHIHVFDGTAYLYASHDYSLENTDYRMEDWHIWSSSDLVTWTLESIVDPAVLYMGSSRDCWAVDVACRNGSYFLYFSHGNKETGVAVADNPWGPFRDALGKPLLDGSLTTTTEYDPSVFIDDDPHSTPYLVFGGPAWAYGAGAGYYIARLNDDMISLAEQPKPLLVNHPADDKASLHKHQGVYYLSWASFYATSTSPYGPFEFRGNIGMSIDHGSFFSFHGQQFNAFTVLDPSLVHRATGLCYVHYDTDGSMHADALINEYGVGQYDGRWNAIRACWYMACSAGISKRRNPRYGFDAVATRDGDWIVFPNVEHMSVGAGITFFASCAREGGCTIEIHDTNPNGALLGICEIPKTRSWDFMGYRSFSTRLDSCSGKANLCFVFRGMEHGEDLLHLQWFHVHQ